MAPGVLAGALALVAILSAPAGAQESVRELATECGGGDVALADWCTEVALASVAARAALGLLASGGSELPGSAGTLGWRVDGIPRVSGSVALATGTLPSPRLRWPSGSAGPRLPSPGSRFLATALRVNAGVGVFDGFSPRPTVGGVLALDALASTSFAFLPGSRGYDDGTATTFGLGVRVGLLRESFTLPAVAISVAHRWSGDVELRPPVAADATPGGFLDLSSTSLRGTVGKDVSGFGLLLGVGWDRYGGEVRVDAGTSPDAGGEWDARSGDLADSRALAFAGVSRTYLILQLSAEIGWAQGLDPVAGRGAGGFDPEDSSWFGSFGVRLVY